MYCRPLARLHYLLPLIISLQSGVVIETRLTSAYNMHASRRTRRRSLSLDKYISSRSRVYYVSSRRVQSDV